MDLLQKALKGKKKEDTEDVIRMLCIYTCLKLFFSTSGTIVGWVFLNYMEDINSMRKYNWVEAIRNTLMSSIEKYHKNLAKVTGCVMALLKMLKILKMKNKKMLKNKMLKKKNKKNKRKNNKKKMLKILKKKKEKKMVKMLKNATKNKSHQMKTLMAFATL
ncbi:hypothetical protein ACSBR2_021882 [Camellia fascicularis]